MALYKYAYYYYYYYLWLCPFGIEQTFALLHDIYRNQHAPIKIDENTGRMDFRKGK